jgi:LacI family transcriptional regulator
MQPRPHVALLIETSNAYARGLFHGIRSYLTEHQSWSIYLADHGRGDILPVWLRKWKGDGIIARVENQQIADELLRLKLPVVDVSVGFPHSPFPRVVTDSQAVSRLAADHLIERGFEHFGYCGDPQYYWSVTRSCYFSEYIRQSGFDCSLFGDIPTGGKTDTWDEETDSIAGWLKTLPKPAGVMACYDIRGQQVLEACRRSGILVPDEIAVIGVHNDELLCDLCDPPLSSVIPNARRAGYEAAALLEHLLNGEKGESKEILLEPVGIATRQSTDVVAVAEPRLSQAIRYIRDHACEGIKVGDVLKAVPMSRTVLERQFKKLLQRTPGEQISRVKIERAKTMLATTDLPIVVVAERVGFEHVEYFSVAFKRLTGITPARFRLRSRA